jgi:hypothetical protein
VKADTPQNGRRALEPLGFAQRGVPTRSPRPSRWANGETELPVGRVARPERVQNMGHAATVRRLYELINAGDIGGFSEHLTEDFVEHEETPGLAPTKEGVKAFFRMQLAAFPDLHMSVEDVFESGARPSRG